MAVAADAEPTVCVVGTSAVVIELSVTTGALHVRFVVPNIAPNVAVIVTVPALLQLADSVVERGPTVAIVLLELDHVA